MAVDDLKTWWSKREVNASVASAPGNLHSAIIASASRNCAYVSRRKPLDLTRLKMMSTLVGVRRLQGRA